MSELADWYNRNTSTVNSFAGNEVLLPVSECVPFRLDTLQLLLKNHQSGERRRTKVEDQTHIGKLRNGSGEQIKQFLF